MGEKAIMQKTNEQIKKNSLIYHYGLRRERIIVCSLGGHKVFCECAFTFRRKEQVFIPICLRFASFFI